MPGSREIEEVDPGFPQRLTAEDEKECCLMRIIVGFGKKTSLSVHKRIFTFLGCTQRINGIQKKLKKKAD